MSSRITDNFRDYPGNLAGKHHKFGHLVVAGLELGEL